MDTLFKLRILADRIFDAIYVWRLEIWNRDLDHYYCCNGMQCGCRGASLREYYTYKLKGTNQ